MIVKILITILAAANGGFMLADGIHVIRKGKYMGPAKPGPWAHLFYKLKIDVFSLGPLFVIFGLTWLFWSGSLWFNDTWALLFGYILSIATLWYISVGTAISIVIIVLLTIFKQSLGFV